MAGGERRMGSYCLMVTQFQFGKEKVLKIDDYVFTKMWKYLIPLSVHLKNNYNVNFVLHVSYLNKKYKTRRQSFPYHNKLHPNPPEKQGSHHKEILVFISIVDSVLDSIPILLESRSGQMILSDLEMRLGHGTKHCRDEACML